MQRGSGEYSDRLPVSRIAALLLLACVHCSSPDSGGGTERGSRPEAVRALMTAEPASLSMIGKPDRWSEILAVQITDSLVQYNEDLNLVPRVARSFEFSDDRLLITFRLRPGVLWHDGQPVTARDVVFSVEQARDPKVENRTFSPLFRDLVSVEAVDAQTVEARYSLATPDVLEAWRLPLIPSHLAEPGAELLTGKFAQHPVGCGPFRFVRHRPGEEIVLEANDEYWDGRPSIDRLVFRLYPDQRTAYQALLTGDLHLMVLSPDLWNEAQQAPQGARLRSLVYYRFNAWLIAWNQDGSNPFFQDPRVRRAMVLALDRPSFIENVLAGLGRPAVGSYHPEARWANPAIEPWPYDPDRARQLLDEAGWRDEDGDGIRERDGKPFRFRLMVPRSTQKISDHMSAWKQDSWKEIGLRAEIEQLEWRHFREKRNAFDFDAAAWTLFFTPNPDHYELYHSTGRTAGINYGGLSDPEVDRLVEQGRASFDPDRRREIYFRLQERLHELEPTSFLFHFATHALHDERLQGIVPTPLDYWRTTEGPRVWRWAGPD